MLMLVSSNTNSDSIFEMSNGCIFHVQSLLLNDSSASLNWVLRLADRLQNGLQFRKCRSALLCITFVHLEHRSPYVIIQWNKKNPMNLVDTRPFK